MAAAFQKEPFQGWPRPEACLAEALKAARSLLPYHLILAWEAAERTLSIVEDRIRKGWTPRDPLSWVRSVARNQARNLARTKKKRPRSLEGLLPDQEEAALPPQDLRLSTPPEWKEALLQHQADLLSLLTERQRIAYLALLRAKSQKEAAQNAGMTQRDLRNVLKEIAKKTRKFLPPPHYLGEGGGKKIATSGSLKKQSKSQPR